MKKTIPCRIRISQNCLVAVWIAGAFCLSAQNKPDPDVLTLVDGEKLIGHLKSATAASVVFKSDLAGDVTVEWKNIQELHTSEPFAVVPKGVELRKSENVNKVPQGTVVVTGQNVQVTPTSQAPQTVPVGNVAAVVDEPTFQKTFHRYGFFEGWSGPATAGIALTEATQHNRTFTASINLVRAIPPETWTDLRNRTIFNFNEAYGELSQPNTPTVKTSLFHAEIEQDRFLSPRAFVFGDASFDHNFSQGLDLQQTYGGGGGLVVLKSASQEFDVKASADFIRQAFSVSSLDHNLIGSIFSETYMRKFAHGITLNEQGSFIPAWNEVHDYSAVASAGLTFPAYHHVGFTVGALENFLNDPPPGFKKNSFQLTVGATFAVQH